MTRVVGLTGGIASGKTHVFRLFQALGVPAIEADEVAREVVAPGAPAFDEIASAFGAALLLPDGSLDRRALRTVVFCDGAALKRLEAITHPHIRQRLRQWIDAQQREPYCVVSAAILIESGLVRLVDRVLVVDAPEADQIRRLTVRDGIDDALARQMMARQLSRAERLAAADDVIDNPDPPQDLQNAVLALHMRYQGKAP